MNLSTSISIYDTTLRDGAQCEGLSLSLEDKLRIARHLDQLGVHFIEGGWPGANPKDAEFFSRLQQEPLFHAAAVAFCSTRRPGIAVDHDRLLQPILQAETEWVTLFGKSWDFHVTAGLKTTLQENLAMITDTILFFRSRDRRVIYDAEHWFDGYKHNPSYALSTLKAAIEAGAEWIVLCDTNGGTLPHEVAQIVQAVKQHCQLWQAETAESVLLGIHSHNDAGTAVANALAAVQEGARMVQGTINGYGERCGNANLCTLIPNLQLKLGYSCLPEENLSQLTRTSRLISEIANLAPNRYAPFIGSSAFAHKAGIHVSAVQRQPQTYEHVSPDLVGNRRRIVISEQSGLSNILEKAQDFAIELNKQDPICRELLQQVKTLENEGYQFEVAEASFELLMRSAIGQRPQFFQLKERDVRSATKLLGETSCTASLATLKLVVNQQESLVAAEGNGPVAALDAALRQALTRFYPGIAELYLIDYKVRILDGCKGTSAKTRVLVEFSNGKQYWTTVGVSTDIVEASYRAIAEGLEYGLLLTGNATQMLPAEAGG